ncbi:MAG: hypothetical protein P4M11_04185 [Candidatus Pacebacteria bacterium]|nr:hypothetical protein [Candidatus Paceibacterota bacterium]
MSAQCANRERERGVEFRLDEMRFKANKREREREREREKTKGDDRSLEEARMRSGCSDFERLNEVERWTELAEH